MLLVDSKAKQSTTRPHYCEASKQRANMAHSGIAFHTTLSFVSHPSCCDARAHQYTRKRCDFRCSRQIIKSCLARMSPTTTVRLRSRCTAPSSSLLARRPLGTRNAFGAPFLKASLQKTPACCRYFHPLSSLFYLQICCCVAAWQTTH
jgi:hypothetical protein